MPSLLRSWSSLFTKLKFNRRQPSSKRRNEYRRRLRFEQCEERSMLATFTVNDAGDFVDSNPSITSLREAIQNANVSPDSDTINFASNLNNATIYLTQGELSITRAVTIDGRDAIGVPRNITIDAGDGVDSTFNTGDGFRIFNIGAGAGSVEFNSLTLTGGDLDLDAGGAIQSLADLTVKNSVITANATFLGRGGGISARGNLTVENSLITGNSAAERGGGIDLTPPYYGVLNILSSTISGNSAINGGGIAARGSGVSVDIQSSRITGNQALLGRAGGGGVYFSGHELGLQSSEIRDNFAEVSLYLYDIGGGGGLFADVVAGGSVTIDQTTIAGNRSTGYNSSGAGAYLISDNAAVTITNTTISNNQALGEEANVGGIAIRAENNSFVDINGLRVSNNHADDDAGGLLISNRASAVILKNSAISGNTATHNAGREGAGGAWLHTENGGTNTLESSTISGNRTIPSLDGIADNVPGGGLFILNGTGTTTTVRNTTISGNWAQGDGGGIKVAESGDGFQSGGALLIRHSTITNNRADSDNNGMGNDSGGGIHIGSSNTAVTIDHAIVAGNFRGSGTTRDDISNSISSPIAAQWSLIGDNTGATITNNGGNQIGTGIAPIPPDLMPLANNGGVTQTHRPRTGSLAIDRGNPGVGTDPLYDQRGSGFPRIYDQLGVTVAGKGPIDIGAFEVGPIGLVAKVIDVRLDSLSWVREPWSYADFVPLGLQHAPMYVQGANRVEVMFSEAVTFAPGQQALALKIFGDNGDPISQTINSGGYESATFTATWTLSSPLERGKYALQIEGVNGPGGSALDGEWFNFDGPDTSTHTPDDFTDDTKLVVLRSGDGAAGGMFRLHFSVLPGDSNQDGIVWDADHPNRIPEISIPLGDDTAAGILADINGDGVRNGADSEMIEDILTIMGTENDVLPLSKYGGDYLDDEIINVGKTDPVVWGDYLVWQATFGSTSDLRADGSMSGGIDGGDYNVWRNEIGSFSAWYTGSTPPPAAVVYVDFGNAPKVVNVTISGSDSYHDPYSFASHVGSGDQLKTVPVGGADTISITFSEDVNVTAEMLRVVEMFTANVAVLAEFSYDLGTMTATWRFERAVPTLPALFGMYIIALDDAVTDVEGNRLDGEWVNPADLAANDSAISEFPTGNGAAGGDFNFVVTILPGDANGDNSVNGADFSIWSAHFAADGVFSEGDFWGDGIVGVEDEELWEFFSEHFSSGFYDGCIDIPWMLADLDGDWDVDQTDIETIADNLGMSNAEWNNGDLNDDGIVDVNDLDLAFAMYGLRIVGAGGY